MIFDWLLEAIGVLGFRSVQERWGVWGIVWLITGLMALAVVVILAVVMLR